MLELWYKVPCPICSKANWIWGNVLDVNEIKGVQCWNCEQSYWFDSNTEEYSRENEMDLRATFGEVNPEVDYVVLSRPRPWKKRFNDFNIF